MISQQIYIIASERSGTNLLRTLIGKHRDIAAPVAPHFFDEFYKLLRYYGDLRIKTNIKRLLKDMTSVANHPYHSWDLKPDIIDKKINNNIDSLARCVDFLYKCYAEQNDKTNYCSKGIHNYKYVHYIENNLKYPKFIYLVRDPRDHVASWLRTPLYMHTAYKIVEKWNREQNECITLSIVYPDDIFLIRYEDLITKTVETMTACLKFLKLDIDENCFSTDPGNKESKRNEFWKNLSKPIDSGNKKKYLNSLNEKQLNIIETISEENMVYFGYNDFESNRNWTKGNRYLFKIKQAYKTYYSKNFKMNKSKDTAKLLQNKRQHIVNIHNNLKGI